MRDVSAVVPVNTDRHSCLDDEEMAFQLRSVAVFGFLSLVNVHNAQRQQVKALPSSFFVVALLVLVSNMTVHY